MIQGTAFNLRGIGSITNAHVVDVAGRAVAFSAQKPSERREVSIKKINPIIDLAIIEIEGGEERDLLDFSRIDIAQMSHVAVCGFPNYNVGDSGIISPGLIIGRRNKSGIGRLLTNAGIVVGMSGGPAVNANNIVCGVCVTGAKLMNERYETEDQAIIPISAIDLL